VVDIGMVPTPLVYYKDWFWNGHTDKILKKQGLF
jgi:hypothetical protein